MNLENLLKILKKQGQSAYREKQIKKSVYVRLINSWDDATDIPEKLRELFKKEIPLSSLVEVSKKNDDNTTKLLFKTHDNNFIEAVLMRHIPNTKSQKDDVKGRNTICISSQAGCPMNCTFCATGKLGFKRNLSSEEIIDQVLEFARLLKKENQKVNNIVFMGMGEPFHNYDNVISAIKILNDKDGFNLGVRHISISTCGIAPAIKKFADEETQVNLAISLHAPNDKIRSRIMPVNKAYNLEKLFEAIDYYIKKTNRKVMFEYVLIAGINDSDENARELAKIMQKKLYHINLIKYHDTGSFKSSSKKQQQRFFDILKKEGVSVTFRISFGENISAACGQLAAKK
jgi:23S rRNA (adenine2503-C2)-methyltransferase